MTFEEQLKKRTRGIVAVNAARAALLTLGASAAVFYAYSAAVYFAPGFVPFRLSSDLFAVLAAAGPIFAAGVILFLHRLDTRRLILTIEESYPHLRERLVTAVEFSKKHSKLKGNPFSLALARSLEDEMMTLLNRFGFGRAASPAKLFVPAALVLAVTGSTLLHAALQPEFFKAGVPAVQRAAVSWPGFEAFRPPAARRFHIEVIPGNCAVTKGSTVMIQARIQGARPREVTLYVKQKQDPAWRIFVMEPAGDSLYQYALTYVTEPSVYFVKAEEQESLRYQIKLSQALAVEKALWRIRFPEHTNLPEESRQGWGPKITVPEGTSLRLELTMNRENATGKILGENGREYRLTPASESTLITDFTITHDEMLKLDIRSAEGEPLMGAPAVWIQTLPDLFPYVEVLEPQFHNYVFPTEEIPFEINVNDDYGMKSVALVVRYQGREERIEWLKPADRSKDKVTLRPVLDLERFKLQSRDLVFAYIEVRDNFPGEPAHVVQSPLFTFLIRDYVEYFKINSRESGTPSLRGLFEEVLVEQEKIMSESWDYLSRLPGEAPKGWEEKPAGASGEAGGGAR